MQLWIQDPHSVEKLMDMKRLEKKGVCAKSSIMRNIEQHVSPNNEQKTLTEKRSCYLLKQAFI